jgi:hypothetical protein
MPVTITADNAQVMTGPGKIYVAILGTSIPQMTVVGGVFTDPWPEAWLEAGLTDSGFQTSHSTKSDPVEVEELYTPIRTEITGKEDSVSFTLVTDTLRTMKLAMNGGQITTTGSADTTLTKYAPPAIGHESRVMIGWEHDNNKLREIYYQCFQTGSVSNQRRKGANKTSYALEFGVEMPAPTVSSTPWNRWIAGAGGLAVV